MSNAISDIFAEITQAELALLKTPLLGFAKALQQPGANILTFQNAGAALIAAAPSQNIPAQAAIFNIVGAVLEAKINSIMSSQPATPITPV